MLSTYSLYTFLTPRVDTMVGFHHPGDPYFPKQGNGGWLEPVEETEEEPEEEREEEPEEEPIGGPSEPVADSDAESDVINAPYMARVPPYRMGPNGPTPPWAHGIWRWSRQQGVRPPFGMNRDYYDLSHGGPAD